MQRIIAATFIALISSTALAGQNVVVPVETFDVKIAESTPVRWEQHVGLSAENAAMTVSAAQKEGGDCHEFPGQNIVCRFPGSGEKRVGLDFSSDRLNKALNGL